MSQSNHAQSPFSPLLNLHSHAICNLVSLNNGYSKTMLDDAGYAKITANKALEFLANAFGFNTYKGMLEVLLANISESDPELALNSVQMSDQDFNKSFEKHFGNVKTNQTLLNLRNLLTVYLHAFQPSIFKHEADVVLNTLSAIKFGHWNDVSKEYLKLNLPDSQSLKKKTVFNHLLTANALGILTQDISNLESADEFEPKERVYFTPKSTNLTHIAQYADFMMTECFKVYSTDYLLCKRNVTYYIAKHLNDPRSTVDYFKSNPNPNTESENDKAIYQVSRQVVSGMPKDVLKQQLKSTELERGWVDAILFGDKGFNSLLENFSKLTACTTEQDWTCMTLRPVNVPTRVWTTVVDYYNAMMDHFKFYFQETVQDQYYNINKIYINKSGLIMYKSDTPLTYIMNGHKGTISANDFCLVANTVLSNRCSREIRSVFGNYMLFYTYYLMRTCQTQEKGIDSLTDVWQFAD